MNYLKDRNSYINTKGDPNQKIILPKRPHSYSTIFDKIPITDFFVCHCGKRFRYYNDIRVHRRISRHFEDRPINNINK